MFQVHIDIILTLAIVASKFTYCNKNISYWSISFYLSSQMIAYNAHKTRHYQLLMIAWKYNGNYVITSNTKSYHLLPYRAEIFYYIKLKSCLSVCPSDRHTDISMVSVSIKTGLMLEMKSESSGTTKYVFSSLNMPAFSHMSTWKATVQAKTAMKLHKVWLMISW